jgi:hypothetical protein
MNIFKGTHDWNKFITPKELQEMLEKCILTFFLKFINSLQLL